MILENTHDDCLFNLFDKKRNMRELGGYIAEDGRSIKHGIFLRGCCLEFLDEDSSAMQVFSELGVKNILDLRSKHEVERALDPSIEGAEYNNICALYTPNGSEMSFSPTDIEEIFYKSHAKDEDDAFVEAMYSSMPFDNPAYKFMFEVLMRGDVPIYFHCTAGKDRTGVAAMLIMLALGVCEDTIAYDYCLTNKYRSELIEGFVNEHRDYINKKPELEPIIRSIYGVDETAPDYVFSQIKLRYVSYKAYFKNEYNLDTSDIAHLRTLYLL